MKSAEGGWKADPDMYAKLKQLPGVPSRKTLYKAKPRLLPQKRSSLSRLRRRQTNGESAREKVEKGERKREMASLKKNIYIYVLRGIPPMVMIMMMALIVKNKKKSTKKWRSEKSFLNLLPNQRKVIPNERENHFPRYVIRISLNPWSLSKNQQQH